MKRLKDILGQESAVDFLRRAMSTDRLGHGLIFTGPSGVGKATTAAALSAWFLCDKPGESDSCGKCESCRAVAALAHPDYHIITKELARVHDRSGTSKATALAINVVRYELAAKAAQKSVMGRGKVFIVEEAHLMTAAAQNALLKTLEEPAGRTLIILLTDHLDDLLATVRSRCQLVRFARLENAKQIAAAATELADGSLGLALRWIEDELLKSVQAVAEEVDAVMSGRSAFDLIEVVKKSAEAQVERLLKRDELTSKDAAMRASLGDYLSIAAQRLRHRLSETEDPDALEQNCRAIDALAQAEKYLAANVNVSLVLEQLGMSIR
jgi:DNA polymerase-3 subunit delta'